jgi:choline transport protein
VLFVFPPELPVTGSNMNYCIVAFAIVIIISTIQWFIDGRKNFKGPHIDVDALKQAAVMGVAIDATSDGTSKSVLDSGEQGRLENKSSV